MFRLVPNLHSDAQIGLLVILLLIGGGLICLYNAYRMCKLPWKPKGPANPKRVCLVILAGIMLAGLLAFFVD